VEPPAILTYRGRVRVIVALGLCAVLAAPAAAARPRLRPFSSCDALVSYARARASAHPETVPFPMRAVGPQEADGVATPTAQAAPAEPDFSGTNVQEQGVDEPDTVKTDGKVLYALTATGVTAVDARADAPKVLGTLTLPQAGGGQMLLHGDRLLVIASGGYGGPIGVGRPTTLAAPYGDLKTTLTEIDVHDPAAMKVLRTQDAEGSFVDARVTGRSARVVLVSHPGAVEPLPEARGGRSAAIRAAGVSTWMPQTTLHTKSGRTLQRKLLGCRVVRRPGYFSGLDMLSILTIDLDKGLPAIDADALFTNADTVYASADSLYVATQHYATPGQDVDALPAIGTTIHRFDISDPDHTLYRSSGDVRGYLLNSFALSEDKGVLRVATTDVPDGFIAPADTESYVTVLRQQGDVLAKVGQVGGLGRGERIQGVRFAGDAGYVVTFRQTDPLYTLDLADPEHPRVAGELKLLGWSAYLHPVGDGLLVGVGQDATEEGRRVGPQLSLFDVSDPAHPSRLARAALSGFSSAAEWDHHAFLYWPATKLVVVPVSGDSESGADGFRVSRDGIAAAGQVRPGAKGAEVSRNVVVGSRLLSLTYAGVAVSRLSDLGALGWVAFPDVEPAPDPEPKPDQP
jgi:hypothetical protein